MKYTILINQAQVVNAGLHEQTDLIDWAILDYISAWESNPRATKKEGYVWINYKHLLREMPLLGLKSKGGVSKRISKLRDLELIETIKDDDDYRLYVSTTLKFHKIINFSEQQLGVSPETPPVSCEKPPVSCETHSTNHHIHLSNINNNKVVDDENLRMVFDVSEQKAAKKILSQISLEKQLEVLAVLLVMIKSKNIDNKVAYLRSIVQNVQDGTFTPIPEKNKPVTAQERIKQEENKRNEADKRAKKDNAAWAAELEAKYGEKARKAIPENFKILK